MRRTQLIAWFMLDALVTPLLAIAAPPVEYVVSLPAPQTQMVDMAITVRQVTGDTIDFCLPVWRPGRYIVLDPAATVREVKAFDGHDQPLDLVKSDKSTWRVATKHAETVSLHYRVYANSLGDRTRHVDDTHAFLSPATVFMYVPQRRHDPLRVRIDAPGTWKIACGLDAAPDDPKALLAPNYDVLVDSPIEVGLHDVIDFEALAKPHQIVLWGNYPRDYDTEQLKKDFTKIIEATAAIFGRLPYERYVFLMHVGAGAGGGTEHLNSTIMQTARASLEDPAAYKRFLGLVAHEFFHTWNVKQFRPEGIHPYDYQHENYTKLLWICEGTTSYYTNLILVRAGFKSADEYLKQLGDDIDGLRNRPAETAQSLEESSFDSWLHFTKSSPDDVNSNVSFYGKGALVSLLLDMTIRERSEAGKSAGLDTVMRDLFERFPLSGRGYRTEDVIAICNEVTASDFSPEFEKYVSGAEPLPFEDALKAAGLELTFVPTKSEKDSKTDEAKDAPREAEGGVPMVAYLGLNMNGNSVASASADGPAYAAGLIAGDEVIAIDGRRVAGGDLASHLKKHKPGDSISVLYCRREDLRTVTITLAGKPDGKWTIKRMKEPSELQKQIYKSWLGQEWP